LKLKRESEAKRSKNLDQAMSCKKEKKLDSVEREKKRDLTNSGEKVRE
jgi:hypothetical protein